MKWILEKPEDLVEKILGSFNYSNKETDKSDKSQST